MHYFDTSLSSDALWGSILTPMYIWKLVFPWQMTLIGIEYCMPLLVRLRCLTLLPELGTVQIWHCWQIGNMRCSLFMREPAFSQLVMLVFQNAPLPIQISFSGAFIFVFTYPPHLPSPIFVPCLLLIWRNFLILDANTLLCFHFFQWRFCCIWTEILTWLHTSVFLRSLYFRHSSLVSVHKYTQLQFN